MTPSSSNSFFCNLTVVSDSTGNHHLDIWSCHKYTRWRWKLNHTLLLYYTSYIESETKNHFMPGRNMRKIKCITILFRHFIWNTLTSTYFFFSFVPNFSSLIFYTLYAGILTSAIVDMLQYSIRSYSFIMIKFHWI